MATYDIGDTIRLSATFKIGSNLTDPDTVSGQIKLPDGTLSTLTWTRDSTGQWHVDYAPATSGRYRYRVVGSGTVNAAEEGVFTVRKRRVGS